MTEFSECLSEMREHYKSNITSGTSGRYKPSPRFAHLFSSERNKSLSASDEEIVGGLKILSKSLNQDEASNIESHLARETQKLKDEDVSSEAQSDFKRKLEERREKAKEKAVENVDRIFDEAEKIEAKYPGSGDIILSTLDLAGALVDEVIDQIVQYVSRVVDSIVAWVETAWASIENTFNDIGNTISGWFSLTTAPA